MKEKKRSVVLFGAGVAIPWNGPTTQYLTELTRNSGGTSFLTKNGEKVTEVIYNALLDTGHKKEETNFETIINAIEELIIHYGYHDGRSKIPSISKTLFKSAFEDVFSNFSIAGGIEQHGYRLHIPEGKEYDYAEYALNNESPFQFYFQHLFSRILININARVSEYSFHDANEIQSGSLIELNHQFIKWYSTLSRDSVVRMYTLNYDRNFKLLAEQLGNPIFEGFTSPVRTDDRFVDGSLQLDRILNDFESPAHYNLHGSSFWDIHPLDEFTQLNNMWVSLSPYISLSNESPTLQIEKGKNIQISNIITGYQKTQKSFASPFRQLQAAFERDCMLADMITIVGYSFGDYHINSSIVNALKHNKKLRLHFIDPAYAEKDGKRGYDLLVQRLIHTFSDVFHFERTQPVYSEDRDSCSYFNRKLTVSMLRFEQYLAKGNIDL